MRAIAHAHDTLTGETCVDELDIAEWTGEGFVAALAKFDADEAGLPVEEAYGFDLIAWVPDEEAPVDIAAFVARGRGPDRMLVAGIVYLM